MEVYVKEALHVLDYNNKIVDTIYLSDDHITPGYAFNIVIKEANTGYSDLTFEIPNYVNNLEGQLVENPKLQRLKPLVKLRYTREVYYTGENGIAVKKATQFVEEEESYDYYDKHYPNNIMEKYLMDYIVQPIDKKRNNLKITSTFTAIDYPRFTLSKKKVGLMIDDSSITKPEWSLFADKKPRSVPGAIQYIEWTRDWSRILYIKEYGTEPDEDQLDKFHADKGYWDPLNAKSYPLTKDEVELLINDDSLWHYGYTATSFYWPVVRTGRFKGVLYEKDEWIAFQGYDLLQLTPIGLDPELYINDKAWHWLQIKPIENYVSPNNAYGYLSFILDGTPWTIGHVWGTMIEVYNPKTGELEDMVERTCKLNFSGSNCYNAITTMCQNLQVYPIFDCVNKTVSVEPFPGRDYGLTYRLGDNIKSDSQKDDGEKVITKLWVSGGSDNVGSANINIGTATRKSGNLQGFYKSLEELEAAEVTGSWAIVDDSENINYETTIYEMDYTLKPEYTLTDIVDELPIPGEDYEWLIYKYTGKDTDSLVHNYYYRCTPYMEEGNPEQLYKWVDFGIGEPFLKEETVEVHDLRVNNYWIPGDNRQVYYYDDGPEGTNQWVLGEQNGDLWTVYYWYYYYDYTYGEVARMWSPIDIDPTTGTTSPWDPNNEEYMMSRSPYWTNYILNLKWYYENGWITKEQILDLYRYENQIYQLNEAFGDRYIADRKATEIEYNNAKNNYDIAEKEYQSTLNTMMNRYYVEDGVPEKGEVYCFHKAPQGVWLDYGIQEYDELPVATEEGQVILVNGQYYVSKLSQEEPTSSYHVWKEIDKGDIPEEEFVHYDELPDPNTLPEGSLGFWDERYWMIFKMEEIEPEPVLPATYYKSWNNVWDTTGWPIEQAVVYEVLPKPSLMEIGDKAYCDGYYYELVQGFKQWITIDDIGNVDSHFFTPFEDGLPDPERMEIGDGGYWNNNYWMLELIDSASGGIVSSPELFGDHLPYKHWFEIGGEPPLEDCIVCDELPAVRTVPEGVLAYCQDKFYACWWAQHTWVHIEPGTIPPELINHYSEWPDPSDLEIGTFGECEGEYKVVDHEHIWDITGLTGVTGITGTSLGAPLGSNDVTVARDWTWLGNPEDLPQEELIHYEEGQLPLATDVPYGSLAVYFDTPMVAVDYNPETWEVIPDPNSNRTFRFQKQWLEIDDMTIVEAIGRENFLHYEELPDPALMDFEDYAECDNIYYQLVSKTYYITGEDDEDDEESELVEINEVTSVAKEWLAIEEPEEGVYPTYETLPDPWTMPEGSIVYCDNTYYSVFVVTYISLWDYKNIWVEITAEQAARIGYEHFAIEDELPDIDSMWTGAGVYVNGTYWFVGADVIDARLVWEILTNFNSLQPKSCKLLISHCFECGCTAVIPATYDPYDESTYAIWNDIKYAVNPPFPVVQHHPDCPCEKNDYVMDTINVDVFDFFNLKCEDEKRKYPYGTDLSVIGYRYNPRIKGLFENLVVSLDKKDNATGQLWTVNTYEQNVSMAEPIPATSGEGSWFDDYTYVIGNVYVRSTSGRIETWNDAIEKYIKSWGDIQEYLRDLNEAITRKQKLQEVYEEWEQIRDGINNQIQDLYGDYLIEGNYQNTDQPYIPILFNEGLEASTKYAIPQITYNVDVVDAIGLVEYRRPHFMRYVCLNCGQELYENQQPYEVDYTIDPEYTVLGELTELPTPGVEHEGEVYKYIGRSKVTYDAFNHNHYYCCELVDEYYKWVDVSGEPFVVELPCPRCGEKEFGIRSEDTYNELIHKLGNIGQIVPKAGDYVSVYDNPMKIYAEWGMITEINRYIDQPSRNSIRIDMSYEDEKELVGNIINATNTVLNYKDIYARTAYINGDGTFNPNSLVDTLNTSSADVNVVSVDGSTLLDGNGLRCVSPTEPNKAMRYTGTGVYKTTTSETENGTDAVWEAILTPEGINATYITSGTIDTNKLNITAGTSAKVVLDQFGLSVKETADKPYHLTPFDINRAKAETQYAASWGTDNNIATFVGVDKDNLPLLYTKGFLVANEGSNIGNWITSKEGFYHLGETGMDVYYCPNCGTILDATATYCPNCQQEIQVRKRKGSVKDLWLSPMGMERTGNLGGDDDHIFVIYANDNFGVTPEGKLYAKGAVIEGDITMNQTGSKIGGFDIASTKFYSTNLTLSVSPGVDGTIVINNTPEKKSTGKWYLYGSANGGQFGFNTSGELWTNKLNAKVGDWYLNGDGINGRYNNKNYKLTPAGVTNVTDNTNIDWDHLISVSDAGLKNNIEPLSDIYNNYFDSLKPVTFRFNKDANKLTHFGFIAQDVLRSNKQINDELGLVYSTGMYYNLDKQEIVALNTWQIQKLKQEVKDLREELEQIKKKA